MKKRAVFLLVFTIFALILSGSACAEGETGKLERAMPDSAGEVLDGADPGDMDLALGRILGYVKDKAGVILGDTLRNGAAVLLVPILCALAGTLYDDKLPDIITIIGALAILTMCLESADSFIGLGEKLMDELDAFGKVLLPTITTAAAATGAVTSSAAKYASSALFLEILMTASKNAVIPLIYAYIAASVGSAVFGGGLEAAAKITKWMAVTAMTALVLTFTLYLTLSGVITGSADAAAVKLTKTAISSALPVVGGIISDAAATVVSGTEMLKNTLGVFGLITVLAACVMPFLRLGISFLIYKAVAALSQPIGGEKLSGVIGAVGTAMGMMMGLCGSMAVMMYISIISIMKVVV